MLVRMQKLHANSKKTKKNYKFITLNINSILYTLCKDSFNDF